MVFWRMCYLFGCLPRSDLWVLRIHLSMSGGMRGLNAVSVCHCFALLQKSSTSKLLLIYAATDCNKVTVVLHFPTIGSTSSIWGWDEEEEATVQCGGAFLRSPLQGKDRFMLTSVLIENWDLHMHLSSPKALLHSLLAVIVTNIQASMVVFPR